MRPSLSLALAPLVVCLALPACEASIVTGGGSGGSGAGLGSGAGGVTNSSGPGGDTTSSSGPGGDTTSSVVSTGSGPPPACGPVMPFSGPCAPQASCPFAGSPCLAADDPGSSSVFGLRMSQISFVAPASITTGIVKSVFESSSTPNVPACNLTGTGTFSWLLRFDTNAGTLTTGGAKPVADPAQGYAFISGGPVNLAPAILPLSLMGDCFFQAGEGDVNLPVYLDQAGMQSVILPLHRLMLTGGFTGTRACIGRYNAEGLDPANACIGQTFQEAGKLSGVFDLSETDQFIVEALNESLCVMLSGNATKYGDGGHPGHCKKDANGQILFQGDWCLANNQPAGGGCADGLSFAASFAASGVQIN